MSISTFLKKKFVKSLFFPSHNRGKALPKKLVDLLSEFPGSWDLPELPELGSPTSEKGLIKDSQDYFSEKFKVQSCWYGVNGASGLIQSAILAMANPGDYILVPRNIHICVIKICIVSNVIPVFFDLDYCEETGQYKRLSEEWLIKVLNDKFLANIKVSGIVLVNPSYKGYSTDIQTLIDLCHKREIPVLVDEAHGSYFLFCENFGLPKSAVRAKADLVVHSLHKSLNGLTQTAMLWHSGNIIKKHRLANSVSFLQTTSPNSLLLASCEEALKDWLDYSNLEIFKQNINEARLITRELLKRGLPLLNNDDPLKIILNTSSYGIDGFTADKFFCEKGIIAELPDMMTLTFCLGFAKQEEFIDLFINIWEKLLNKYKNRNFLKSLKPPFPFLQCPQINPSSTVQMKSQKLALKECVGKISAEIVCPYPPGIPLIIPGEIIDKQRVDWLIKQGLFDEDLLNFYIRVLKP